MDWLSMAVFNIALNYCLYTVLFLDQVCGKSLVGADVISLFIQ